MIVAVLLVLVAAVVLVVAAVLFPHYVLRFVSIFAT